jgi:hydrogenase maturation protease
VSARVIGIGQPAAGDDGVGLAVIAALRGRVPAGVALYEVTDTTDLIPLLEAPGLAILIDAVVGLAPGEVAALRPEEAAGHRVRPFSTHGLGVQGAVALARGLAGGAGPEVQLIGIGIPPPSRYGYGLSEAVAGAVPHAAALALALLGG